MPKTRSPYPAEFRRQMVELARAGRSAEELAGESGHRNYARKYARKYAMYQDAPRWSRGAGDGAASGSRG